MKPYKLASKDALDPDLALAMLRVDGRNKEILKMRFKGYSLNKIGKHFNVCRERIRQLIDEMRQGNYENSKDGPGGVRGSTYKKVRERLPKVKALRDLGLEVELIAAHLKVNPPSIFQDFKRLDKEAA